MLSLGETWEQRIRILNNAACQCMESSWFWIDSGIGDAASNMAFDLALLENATRLSAPILRFYGWTQPSASFGYFQHFDEVSRMTPLRPLVRRPTGGGLVLHNNDWTYSVVVPPGHGWFELAARESYRRIHEWIRKALAISELTTELCSSRVTERSGVCFAGAEVSDLLQKNRKVAGAAQRRNRMGLLIQGSLAPSGGWPARDRWQESMRRVLQLEQGVTWTIWAEDLPFKDRVQVSAHKFGSEIFTRKR